jgi:hypothetical protein
MHTERFGSVVFGAVLVALLNPAASGCASAGPSTGGDAADVAATSDVATAAESGADASASACRAPGEACSGGDYCGSWTCRCRNISMGIMTVGGCTGGHCSQGTEACDRICQNAGGVENAMYGSCF